MKDTKRYRAETLREALEQIKQDLGEEALVLGHKKVRAGGMLGIGTREMVEVQAALDPKGIASDRKTAKVTNALKPEPESRPQASEPQPTTALASRVT